MRPALAVNITMVNGYPRRRVLTMRVGYAGALALLLVACASSARADEKEACIAASEGADRLDDAAKLIELRYRLAFCARDLQMGVAGIIGVTAATVGTILLLTSFESKRTLKRGARVTPSFGPGYAGLSLAGSF